jgi:hypothetical protein
VPSSTFSSEPRRIPAGPWGATWLVAIALAIAGLWGLEQLSRARGHRPSITDDPIWWSMSRRTVDDDPKLVVFLGASRMALGYEPRAFAEAAPDYRGLQLSISDYLPGGVLQDLAADDSFRGIVVIDLIETEIADPLLMSDGWIYARVTPELSRMPGAVANRYLGTLAQDRFAVLAVGGRRIVTALAGKRAWPTPAWVAIDRERTSHADYSLATPKALRDKADRRLDGFPAAIPERDWHAILDMKLEPLVRAIQARGGQVVVVKPPVSGRLAHKLDEVYPRERYWDVFAKRSAAHVIHFRDVPGMAELECPDEMHLDQKDQAAFTRALVMELRRRGVLR